MCLAGVGLMGDMCRALGSKIMPYCDETMMILLENLGVSKPFNFQMLLKLYLHTGMLVSGSVSYDIIS